MGDVEAACKLFDQIYFDNPLVTVSGDDSELYKVVSGVAFHILHQQNEWQLEVDWWKAIISTMEKYDQEKNTSLHKGLPYHNIILPLLELGKFKEAADYERKAIKEDKRKANGNESYKESPAYRLGCFLIPIVQFDNLGISKLSELEKQLLLKSFQVLFLATKHAMPFGYNSVIQGISDEGLKATLLKRYERIERNMKGDDPDALAAIVYAGSIVEGILSDFLVKNKSQAVSYFRSKIEEDPSLIWRNHTSICPNLEKALEKLCPREVDRQGDAVKRWAFHDGIFVANGIRLFNVDGSEGAAALLILANLLKNYRNLIHPSKFETLVMEKDWSVTFEISVDIARMIKASLDITLYLLSGTGSQKLLPPQNFDGLIIDSGHHGNVRNSFASTSVIQMGSSTTTT